MQVRVCLSMWKKFVVYGMLKDNKRPFSSLFIHFGSSAATKNLAGLKGKPNKCWTALSASCVHDSFNAGFRVQTPGRPLLPEG